MSITSRISLAALAAAALASGCSVGATGGPGGGDDDGDDDDGTVTTPTGRVIGYFPAWAVYGRDYHVDEIPGELLTHINYAFLNIANGECVLGDSYADIDKFYPGDSWDAGAVRG